MAIWEDLCRRADRIVELGANVGYYTIAGGAAASGIYVAYEPHPRSCAALRTNLELNGLDRVQVVEAAAVPDSATSSVELVCPTGTDGAAPSGAMVKGSALEGDGAGRDTESFMVDAVGCASAIAGADLVKIDVEGLEAQLLGQRLGPAVLGEARRHDRDPRVEQRSAQPRATPDGRPRRHGVRDAR